MGLYAQIDQGGFPDEVIVPLQLSGGFANEVIIEIDYTPAFEAACARFNEVANELVPVDTGYLKSTLSSTYDSYSAEFFADAEYAQYVEYGTYKMDAQPYFRPAIEEAKYEFNLQAQILLFQAQQEAQFEIGSYDMAGGSISALLDIMMLFFMLMIRVLIDEFFNLISGNNDNHSAGGGDITIT